MDDAALERALLKALQVSGPADTNALAAELSVSPDQISGCVFSLTQKGVPIDTKPGGTWSLDSVVAVLDRDEILTMLEPRNKKQLGELELVWETGSTNTDLLKLPPPVPGKARARLAEYQSAGRGRQGKQWQAPLGGSVSLSLAWTFAKMPSVPAGLALASGVAVRNALQETAVRDVQLKWPNDLLWRDRKLGGVLLEMRHNQAGQASVVIGIGLNYRLTAEDRREILTLGGMPPVDIMEIAGDHAPGRNALAAELLSNLLDMLTCYETEGLAPFVAEWCNADACRDRGVAVTTPSSTLRGIARGIDADGALRIEVDGAEQRIVSAEVSLRPA